MPTFHRAHLVEERRIVAAVPVRTRVRVGGRVRAPRRSHRASVHKLAQ